MEYSSSYALIFQYSFSAGLSPITIPNSFSFFAIKSSNSFCDDIPVKELACTSDKNAIALCKFTKQYPALDISALELRYELM